MLGEWQLLNITSNISIGSSKKLHMNMALMLGSKERFSLLCGNIYTNIPKIVIDVIIILNLYYFKTLPCMYWYEANIRFKSYWFVKFLIPLSMLVYTLWFQLGAHPTLEKNEQRTQGFWAIFSYTCILKT
jgi:hypothetical protein